MTDEEAKRYKEHLKDRWWRLNNLYRIIDKNNQVVTFKMKPAQVDFYEQMWLLNVILKSRQIGFSTEISVLFLDDCLFTDNLGCGIIDITLNDAKKKLEKAKFAYDGLPECLRSGKRAIKNDSTTELKFENGSSITVGTSYRGGTLQRLHISEYGKIAAKFPQRAEEIKTGAFDTVAAGQMIFVESTAEGVGGEFHDMCKEAQDRLMEKRPLTPLSFKFHFYAWWQDEDCELNALIPMSKELTDYFEKLEADKGIKLGPRKRAWYAAKLEQHSGNWSHMFREYPSTPAEAFFAAVKGAYFSKQMTQMRLDGRLGNVPYDPSLPVNTFWDIGHGDATAVWFHQSDGVTNRLIHYYENSGESVEHYAAELKRLAGPKSDGGREFVYGKHYGPHDLKNHHFGITGNKTVEQVARNHGIKFVIVPRVGKKADSIQAARTFLCMTWIDKQYCKRGVQVLDSYQKVWDEARGTWKSEPLRNWATHGADALQGGAMGIKPGTASGPSQGRSRSSPGNLGQSQAWTA